MHIMMVTNNYSPYTGGVVSSINATVEALQRQGHRVTLATFDFLGHAHNDDPAWVKRLVCPIKFLYKKNHMAIAWRARKQLKQLIAELAPDIVHVHHPFLLGYIAGHIAKAQHIPVLFTYHTIYEAYVHYIFLPKWITRYVVKQRVLSFCRYVNGIIAPSSSIKNYLLAEHIGTPIKVIPSSVQNMFLSSCRMSRPIEGGLLRLLTVSRMVKEKNIAVLLRVAAELVARDVRFTFTLVGYGTEYEPLRVYAYEELKLSSTQIIFVHQPSKEQIIQLYQESDVFLFSSHTDTQGLVLAEAMASGLPVIALDGPGQRDIVVQGKNGFIVADEHEMVAQVMRFTVEPIILSDLSRHAYLTAQRYRSDVLVQRLLSFYLQFTEVV